MIERDNRQTSDGHQTSDARTSFIWPIDGWSRLVHNRPLRGNYSFTVIGIIAEGWSLYCYRMPSQVRAEPQRHRKWTFQDETNKTWKPEFPTLKNKKITAFWKLSKSCLFWASSDYLNSFTSRGRWEQRAWAAEQALFIPALWFALSTNNAFA